jgi:hypothetical protein
MRLEGFQEGFVLDYSVVDLALQERISIFHRRLRSRALRLISDLE